MYLLRSASSPDPYIMAFEAAGLAARCEPVLQFEFPHQNALAQMLSGAEDYGGLVVTSPRAVRAVAEVLEAHPSCRDTWTAKPAFAVGPKTASALRTAGFTPEGEESGTAAALVDVIARRAPARPLLFCTGNRRRDALPEGLTRAGVAFEEVEVYRTHPRVEIQLPSSNGSDWLLFFSPSGIEAIQQSPAVEAATYRCGAIGPTTAAALRSVGWEPEAVAKEPAPDALVAAVVRAIETEG